MNEQRLATVAAAEEDRRVTRSQASLDTVLGTNRACEPFLRRMRTCRMLFSARMGISGMLDDYPNLSAFVARGEARPAYKRAFDAQSAVNTGKQPAS